MHTYRPDPSKKSWVQGLAFWIFPVLVIATIPATFFSGDFPENREAWGGWLLIAGFTIYFSYFRLSTPLSLTLTPEGRLLVERRSGTQEIFVSDILRIRALWISWENLYQIKHTQGSVMLYEPFEDFDDLFRRLREANSEFRSG